MKTFCNGVRDAVKLTLQKLWLTKTWCETDTFHLYIDSPFCVQECRFCTLNSTSIRKSGGETYRAYYKTLINEILDWNLVLGSHAIDTVYFGGGTSTLMSVDVMKAVFDSIPAFLDIQSKCFECDPLSLTKTKIDTLADVGFSYLTFGIQTLNAEELRRQNRINQPLDALKELTDYALKRGMRVSYDIMAFLSDGISQDMERLRSDLDCILSYMKPTAIDLYPTMPKLEGDHAAVIEKVLRLRSLLGHFVNKYQDYQLADQHSILVCQPSFSDRYRNYFLIRMNPNEYFCSVKRYSCSDPETAPITQNTLGLGGYGPREVYSYLDKKEIRYRSRFDEVSNRFVYY